MTQKIIINQFRSNKFIYSTESCSDMSSYLKSLHMFITWVKLDNLHKLYVYRNKHLAIIGQFFFLLPFHYFHKLISTKKSYSYILTSKNNIRLSMSVSKSLKCT